MEKLFIDTGAWIALNNKKDKYYRDAVKANKDFLDKGYFYISSDYVLDESYTLLRYEAFSFDGHFEQYGFTRLPIFLSS